MKKYTIITRPDEDSLQLEKKLHKVLTAHDHLLDSTNPEIVFVVGGDGTFIYAVHHYLDQLENLCFYGIHTGTLGFYTDFKDSDFDEFLTKYLNGDTFEIKYPLLEVHEESNIYYAINEMRIENVVRTQEMDVYINNQRFETYRGTGMCVSSQNGSTAYNRSLGGAVLQEGLNLIEMCEIAGIHHKHYRSLSSPLVMSDTSVIRFESDNFTNAILGIDSDVYSIDEASSITVQTSPTKTVRVLRGREISYFSRLQSLFL
ncbi:MAG: NAD kinase [Solobacterium sp.]|nr:NAD kinase [Solobacterium sp.]